MYQDKTAWATFPKCLSQIYLPEEGVWKTANS